MIARDKGRAPAKGKEPSQRQLKVGETIRHALADIFSRGEIVDEVLDRHSLTVPEVRMSPDLKLATVYIITLGGGEAEEAVAHLDKHKRYPAERSQKGAEILVSFALDRMGHVLSASIVKGSGDTAFDEAALAMVRKSDPVPMPPPRVADEGLNFTLPVIFRVKGRS